MDSCARLVPSAVRRLFPLVLGATGLLFACDPANDDAPAPPASDDDSTVNHSTKPASAHDAHEAGHEAGHGAGHEAGHEGGHHRFEDAEAWAKTFDDPARDAWQKPDAVIDWLELAPDARVADLGAGTGYFAVRLAKAVPRGSVVGQDIEASMVEYMTKRFENEGILNATSAKGSAEASGLQGKFDLILVVDVFHHVDEPATYFASIGDLMAPGGRLVVVDFDPEAPEDAPGPPAKMRMSIDEVSASLDAAGWRPKRRNEELLPYQYILEFVRADAD